MPKKPSSDAPQGPSEALTGENALLIIPIASGDPRLPGGLHLGVGPFTAVLLSDGRVVPQGLPPTVMAAFYPDLTDLAPSAPDPSVPLADEVPPPPSVEEI
jgi:hypothetical protein